MYILTKYIKDKIQSKTTSGKKRSSRWPSVRAAFLKKNPRCALCNSTAKLEVHHKIPFCVDSSLELVESNLITLCENKKYGINCHLLVGHLGNYRKFNKSVEQDVLTWHSKIKE